MPARRASVPGWVRLAAGLGLCAGLAACSGMVDPGGYGGGVGNLFGTGHEASDSALVALEKGDYSRAESLATRAEKADAKDPYAMFVLAQVYQATGRPELATKYYQALVSMNPQQTVVQGIGVAAQRRTIAEIAKAQLATLRSAALMPLAATPTPMVQTDDLGEGPDANIARRFRTLRRLLDEGLVTQDEYNQRRGVNMGALTPYSAPPPSAGLDRPAPSAPEVVDRIRTLVAAYEAHSIGSTELQVERNIILDNLLPANPDKRADSPPPLTGQMQAAAAVGRVVRFFEQGVLTAEEEARAKDEVFKLESAYEDQAARAARMASGVNAAPAAMASGAAGHGARLSTYESEGEAQQGWAALQKQFPDQLGSLQPRIRKIALRRGGTVWAVDVGPLADRKAVAALCAALRKQHQDCTPVTLK